MLDPGVVLLGPRLIPLPVPGTVEFSPPIGRGVAYGFVFAGLFRGSKVDPPVPFAPPRGSNWSVSPGLGGFASVGEGPESGRGVGVVPSDGVETQFAHPAPPQVAQPAE